MSDLEGASQAFKEAFDAYVATISDSPKDAKRVIGTMNELHAATTAFTDASMRSSGWGSPFLQSEDDGASREVGGVPGEIVEVEARYLLRVNNSDTSGSSL